MLGARIRRIDPSSTLGIAARANELRDSGVDVIDLSIGEPDFATPAHIKQAAKDALDKDFTHYTANVGVVELRQAICDKLERDNGLHYQQDEVLVSPGAKFSCYATLRALLEAGQEVVMPAPCWVSYPAQVRLAGGFPVLAPTRQEDGFRLTADQLREVINSNTGMLILNDPSNPSGTTYSPQQLAEIAEVCLEHDVWILADEIYEKLVYDGHEHASIAAVSAEVQARTVLINGVSKAYAMTGWRIGYAAGPKEAIEPMAKIQGHATSAANSIAQAAAVAALQGPLDDVAAMVARFKERRNLVVERLRAIDCLSCGRPKGAFYLFPNVSGAYGDYDGMRMASAQDVATYLLERAHVAVVPGEAFGYPHHLRISYANTMERLEQGVQRMAAALRCAD